MGYFSATRSILHSSQSSWFRWAEERDVKPNNKFWLYVNAIGDAGQSLKYKMTGYYYVDPLPSGRRSPVRGY
jgi:hypothetical protein